MEGWEVYIEALRRKREGQDILMLSIGDHDFHTPNQTVAACVRALENGHHHYTDIAGYSFLRSAMAKISERATNVPTAPEEVITSPGGQAALYGAIQATMDDGDHGVIVGPYYVTYPGTLRSSTTSFTYANALPEDGFEPRPETIEAAITDRTKVLLINSPNNPTGVIFSRQTLEAIADICIRHDLWLISDEVYWSLSEGKHISPRSLPGMKERTLVINSMSKSHAMTGWRVGWLTAPVEMVGYLTQLNLISTYGISDFISHAAAAALDGDFGVDEIANTYASRRKTLMSALAKIEGISLVNSAGGMYVMIDVRAIEPDGGKFALALLDRENLAVMPGESFGPSASGHLRLTLCQPDHLLEEAAERVGRVVKNYHNKTS